MTESLHCLQCQSRTLSNPVKVQNSNNIQMYHVFVCLHRGGQNTLYDWQPCTLWYRAFGYVQLNLIYYWAVPFCACFVYCLHLWGLLAGHCLGWSLLKKIINTKSSVLFTIVRIQLCCTVHAQP